ncbi:DUF4199 domain-containing protein [Chryseosolibacter indicus]|uniref:DUF4199 family protein n=1 Tax=Chryseosolibacter indicus TaxID=2782351 RepID=A0ABS5VTN4_9BACT|nr:DUF4199 domain-containing protein [Chryseosolibacter indicus]MBT1704787.1 DUF4199 family protein [Chryseosolibacter indicus]
MKKVVLINGVIAGSIVSIMLLISTPLLKNGVIDFDSGMLIGYASMVLAMSMIFVGIKTYRDHYKSGVITFLQGFKIGILIALVAAVIYATTWEFYYNLAASDFTEFYTQHYLDKMKSEGASEAELSQALKEMENFNATYKNPVLRFAITLTEILPVGLIITLISAAVLRKRQILPA